MSHEPASSLPFIIRRSEKLSLYTGSASTAVEEETTVLFFLASDYWSRSVMVAPNASQGDDLYVDISSADEQIAITSLRTLKNDLIGYPDRKREAVQSGVVPKLAKILQIRANPDAIKIQAAIVLASLCQSEAVSFRCDNDKGCTWQFEERHIIDILLHCISESSSVPLLVSPCLRALNSMILAGADNSAIWSKHLGALITISQAASNNSAKSIAIQQATYVASLFSTFDGNVEVEPHQAEVVLASLIGITINITQLGNRIIEGSSPGVKLLEATLSALGAMTRSNATFATQLAVAGRLSHYKCVSDECPMVTTLLRLVRSDSNLIRLGSSSCLTNLFRHGATPRKSHKEIALSAVPILVRLFDDVSLRSRASYILTDLVKDSDDMQRAACDAGAIQRLSTILQQHRTSSVYERTIETALLALAAITLQKDEYRKQVIDAKVVPLIVASMGHTSPRIRAAACQCARSLSRSVAMLRTSLIDAGVATAVFELMSDPDIAVKTSATAAVCNLVLEFSPMRRMILDSGILVLLGKLCIDGNAELRLNAVWAIKHIVYAADTDVKMALLHELKSDLILQLCDDAEAAIQEQACEVIRNMVCGKPENIDLLIDCIGIEKLADFLLRKLLSNVSEIVISAIYSVVHIAAGAERHRMILMQRASILEALHHHLAAESEEIKIGAVWTIINLTWQEDEATASERRARINVLESLGFKQKLREMESDRSLDVRERVKTALAQLQ